MAATFTEKQWAKDLVKDISNRVRENKEWIGVALMKKNAAELDNREVRMLDYACGPGNIASVRTFHIHQVNLHV